MKDEFPRDPGQTPEEPRPSAPTPLSVRILAGIGALLMIGLSVAFAYSIATGGIFWF